MHWARQGLQFLKLLLAVSTSAMGETGFTISIPTFHYFMLIGVWLFKLIISPHLEGIFIETLKFEFPDGSSHTEDYAAK